MSMSIAQTGGSSALLITIMSCTNVRPPLTCETSASRYGPVSPHGQHPREYSGSHWSVLVSRTTPTPVPGSDEINRAYEEGWVGNHALAFIGDTLSTNGARIPELFIVTLPESERGWKQPGDTPLAGTETTMPAPPAGVMQRRLTFTHHRRYPGLVNTPRHWVRSQPAGNADCLPDARRGGSGATLADLPRGAICGS